MKPTWIKLENDLFDNKKIKKIRRMPDGDKILLIWIYLLTNAGKCNACGMIYICENVPLDIEDIAEDLKIELNVIRLAIETLKRLKMIVIENDIICIRDWENHQNSEGLEKIREQARIRQQRYRENQKKLLSYNKKENKKENKNKRDDVTLRYLDSVYLTEKEYNTLVDKYGINDTNKLIEKLDNYKGANGKKYKNDYKAILNWVIDSLKIKPLEKPKENKPDCLEGMQF